jgi:hypothetical protein
VTGSYATCWLGDFHVGDSKSDVDDSLMELLAARPGKQPSEVRMCFSFSASVTSAAFSGLASRRSGDYVKQGCFPDHIAVTIRAKMLLRLCDPSRPA